MSKVLKQILDIPTLTEEHISNLKNYKYASCEYTPLDNLMNHFWKFAAKFIPKVSSLKIQSNL